MSNIKEVIKKVVATQRGKNWGETIASYKITFDSQTSQLESIYYWVLDFVSDAGWNVKKIVDNFMSSPGSGHFSDMGQRTTKMQEEGMKLLGALNQVIKSVLNLIYDLKEFEIRLESYSDAKSNDKSKKEAGLLALKQIWLDSVDLKRGRGSIHQMANEMGFSTIRELFMITNSAEDLDKLNSDKGFGIVNDQVARILKPRIEEFNKWKIYSEKELTKRMQIEKSYLKSQVETIKLYSSWVKPYLDSAEQLRQKGFEGNAALVNAFSTSLFELELFGKKEAKPPVPFADKKLRRKYYQCILINLKYRGHVSQKVTQKGDYGYAAGGRLDMTFDCYSLNEEEITLIEKELEKGDLMNGLKYSANMAEDALNTLKEDLDHYLKNEDEVKQEKKEEKKGDDVNPATVIIQLVLDLFSGGSKKDKGKIESPKDVKKDNYVESLTRVEGAKSASDWLFTVYDVYKKFHGMESSSTDFQNANKKMITEPEVEFSDVLRGRGKLGK